MIKAIVPIACALTMALSATAAAASTYNLRKREARVDATSGMTKRLSRRVLNLSVVCRPKGKSLFTSEDWGRYRWPIWVCDWYAIDPRGSKWKDIYGTIAILGGRR